MLIRLLVSGTFVFSALACATSAWATVVSDWNAAALAEVRLSRSLRNGPPVVARALAIAHTCMYDAWAAYDDVAVGTTDTTGSRRRPVEERTDDNKKKAISFAAYRCLRNLYPDGSLPPPLPQPSVRLNAVLLSNGYALGEACITDEECRNSSPETAAGLGNIAAQAVIDARRHDGSNQYGDLAPAPCPVPVPWPHPCAATAYGQTPANPTTTGAYSDYVAADYSPYLPGNPLMGYCNPLMVVCTRQDIVDPNRWQPLIFSNGQICLDSGSGGTEQTCPGIQVFIAPHWERVTPFALTSAGQFDDQLTTPPPDFMKNFGQYDKDVSDMIQYSKKLDTLRKLIVEYWADGPSSELPPGHWGIFAQFVSQRDNHTVEQDVKMFFAMHNASFDAGIVAWHIKRKYDGVRPITAIRFARRGEIIRAWGGPGQPIENIPGEKWSPYNPGTNLTPPFPGYFSGHSVFSRSSATVLMLFTGSDAFGFSTVLPAGFGRVEPNIPPVPTTLSYATFSDAANEAGLSRLYGGIHFSDDNESAQSVGYLIGVQAWTKALTYFNGMAR
jgi:hypothetical protein